MFHAVFGDVDASPGNKVRIRVQRGVRGDDSGGRREGCVGNQLSGKSQEFTLHRYMLTLVTQPCEPFYKDEGGKSKVSLLLLDQIDTVEEGSI